MINDICWPGATQVLGRDRHEAPSYESCFVKRRFGVPISMYPTMPLWSAVVGVTEGAETRCVDPSHAPAEGFWIAQDFMEL